MHKQVYAAGMLEIGQGDIAMFQQSIDLVTSDQGKLLTRASELSPDVRDMRAARVKRVIHERNRRAEYFRGGIFSDPAWDLLLELYASDLSQEGMFVDQVGILSNVPATTAGRWAKLLECEGLVSREVDPQDTSSVRVKLTRKGETAMNSYFRGGPGE